MHRGLESLFHLARGSAELNDPLALGNVFYGEALVREPILYLLDVIFVGAEGVTKFFRRDPLMIVNSPFVLLLIDNAAQLARLLGLDRKTIRMLCMGVLGSRWPRSRAPPTADAFATTCGTWP